MLGPFFHIWIVIRQWKLYIIYNIHVNLKIIFRKWYALNFIWHITIIKWLWGDNGDSYGWIVFVILPGLLITLIFPDRFVPGLVLDIVGRDLHMYINIYRRKTCDIWYMTYDIVISLSLSPYPPIYQSIKLSINQSLYRSTRPPSIYVSFKQKRPGKPTVYSSLPWEATGFSRLCLLISNFMMYMYVYIYIYVYIL